MRLYAKIRTDRGEAGKGARERLEIELLAGHKERREIGRIVLQVTGKNKHRLTAWAGGEKIERELEAE